MDQLKVLIVDDETLVRTKIRVSIDWEDNGYEIIGDCGSAEAALDLMEEETPDIILADICMPVVDGLKFAKQVRQQNPEIQIIFLTGHDKFSYANDSIKIGVFDYLLKPVDAGELLETLSRARMKIEKERRHNS